MDTNILNQVTQAANDAGFKLTGTQVTLIVGIGAAAARWLRGEIKLAVETWANVGGMAGIKTFFLTGKPKTLSTAPQPVPTAADTAGPEAGAVGNQNKS
jgi:hypothetical protein